jgi:chromosome segregation ATPase
MRAYTFLICGVLAAATVPASAQSARKDSGGNAQLMQQMQQMAAERTQLQAENARMKKELDEVRKERDGLKAGKDSDTKRARNSEVALAQATRARDQTTQELDQYKARTQELIAKFRDTITQMRSLESEHTSVKQQLVTRDLELKSCTDNNVALYKLNDEVLTKFESQGFWSSMARAEPFTKIKRVELENMADGYRGRADDAKLPPAAAATSTSPPGS